MPFRPLLWVSFGLVALLGCATPPPPPASAQASVIAIAVKIKALVGYGAATAAYFVRVDDPAVSEEVIRSNYVNGEYVYLLNALPGRYALVAAREEWTVSSSSTTTIGGEDVMLSGTSTKSHTVYAQRALFEETTVAVSGGDVAFMGEAFLESSSDWEKADSTQRRYYDLVPWYKKNITFMPLEGDAPAIGYSLDRSVAAWERFLDHSRTELAGTGWEGLLQQAVAPGSSEE